MVVQLDRAFYYPGEVVNGKVFISSVTPVGCQMMELSCEGKEKVEFTRFYYVYVWRRVRVHRDGRTHWEWRRVRVEKSERVSKKKKQMDFKVPLMDMGAYGYNLHPGNYMAGFSFTLPRKISSSLSYKNHGIRQKPEAKVEHKIKIKLYGPGGQPIKSKTEIVVRQLPFATPDLVKKKELKVTKCGCCDQGKLKISTHFLGNFFDKNEQARVMITMDNKDCKADMKAIEFQIRHALEFRVKNYTCVTSHTIKNHTMEGVKGGEDKTIEGVINMHEIRDHLMSGNNSKLIKSYHYQTVKAAYGDCCICADAAHIDMPSTIIESKIKPVFQGFVPPAGAYPTDLGHFNLAIADYFNDTD